ncbi:hypothetical protein [Bacillus alkalicellulosilyticus]|uniref:hypothetical protein n=1 Tax=Alkalihalobacterium alkalicellulosilyticum TaxID=1912214 RepID=UPI000996681A|nr:hypothetical protein [Bacillus alkalicellulosilyticus]
MNVKNAREHIALQDLVVASLLSNGELCPLKKEPVLIVPFTKEKALYLLNYLKSNNLGEYVRVKEKSEEFEVILDTNLYKITQEWYKNREKIFSKKLGATYVGYSTIILCINLFGNRKLESIGIPSSIHKDLLKTLTYHMEKCLEQTVIPGKNEIKIPEVPNLFLDTLSKVSSINSTEIANFLTNHEKNKLIQVSSQRGGLS